MTEILLPPKDLTSEAREYGRKVLQFVERSDFPVGLLSYPDHLMIKTGSPADFDKRVKSIKPWAEHAAFIDVDSRFLVAARLLVPLALMDNRPVNWIEIMESKAADKGNPVDYLGVEYAEFYHENFNHAGQVMEKQKIDFERRADGLHRWWNVKINDEGQELRITDRSLSDIIVRELEDGTAKNLSAA